MADESTFGKPAEQLQELFSIGADGLTDEDKDNAPSLAALDLMIEKPGSKIGGYRLLRVLGEGGMGIVYLAQQDEPVVREVALKVIKPGMDSKRVMARFEAEEQALALMEHPHVARVYDAGLTGSGRPYFVMEYVKGIPITEHCDQHKLTIKERLNLFLQVCHAVHHAHQKGIIHRDIKPSNILVSTEDDQAVPKIIDFGVAKATAKTLTRETLFTEQGQLFGTPEYMSPEQADMANEDIDTRSDIYSLGVLLYVLLTGTHPFDTRDLRQGGLEHVRQVICEIDPKTPSTRLTSLGEEAATVAEMRSTEISTLAKHLKRELEWIPLKAMRKERAERYRSASELADDVENYLKGVPLLAGPPGIRYRLGKFVRRNRALVSGMAAVLIVFIAGVVGIAIFAVKAERRRTEMQLVSDFLRLSVIQSHDPYYAGDKIAGGKISVRSVLDIVSEGLEGKFKALPGAEAEIRSTLGWAYWSHGLYKKSESHLKRAIEMNRSHRGREDPNTLRCIKTLAWVYYYDSRYNDSEPLFVEAAEGFQRVLGAEHEATLHAKTSLGTLYFVQGRFAEAEQLSGKALAIMQNKKNMEIGRLVDYLFMLGYGYRLQGRYQEAEPLITRAFEISRQKFKQKDWRTLGMRQGLGSLYWDQGRYEEAEQQLDIALTSRREIWGEHHPETLATKDSLGWLHYSRGQHEQAEKMFTEVLEAAQRLHKATTHSMHGLGTLYLNQGRHDEAEPLLKEAVNITNELLGENNWHALHIVNTLSRLYTAQGRFVAAEKQYIETLKAQRHILGNEHPHTLASINDLAVLYTRQRQYDEATTLSKEALEGRQRKLGHDHPATLESMHDIGKLYLRQGQYEKSEAKLVEAYEGRKDKLGPEHPHTLNSLKQLIQLYEAWDKPDKAKEWQDKLSAFSSQ